VFEAERIIPRILEEWEQFKQQESARAAKLEPVIAELKSWDRVSRIDSKAMTLFIVWLDAITVIRLAKDEAPWKRMRALERVIADLTREFGTWRVDWGEINRLQGLGTR